MKLILLISSLFFASAMAQAWQCDVYLSIPSLVSNAFTNLIITGWRKRSLLPTTVLTRRVFVRGFSVVKTIVKLWNLRTTLITYVPIPDCFAITFTARLLTSIVPPTASCKSLSATIPGNPLHFQLADTTAAVLLLIQHFLTYHTYAKDINHPRIAAVEVERATSRCMKFSFLRKRKGLGLAGWEREGG
ncbi:hypothetical protein K440DRAFT_642523 [Wilcoxina mikolae CBS 423.85]|nr:hypothetical protein K440DRAFT_642523 [Wilcoxina mikolae CBS 423.85]